MSGTGGGVWGWGGVGVGVGVTDVEPLPGDKLLGHVSGKTARRGVGTEREQYGPL